MLAVVCGSAAAADMQADPVDERAVFHLLNDDRQAAGVAAVEWDDQLAQAARRHAFELAKHHALSHQFPGEPDLKQRIIATGLRFDKLAENVAFADTPDEINQSFLNSPPHRLNMLNPDYNAVGIGAVRMGQELYVVQDFAHRTVAYSETQAEDQVTAAMQKLRGEPALIRVDAPLLHDEACSMAQRDQLTTPDLNAKLPKVRYFVRFTAPDPRQIPDTLVAAAKDPVRTHFAVGACYGKSSTYPEGIYWVVVGLY
jgi:uncharacterized protein YkwD